MGGSAGLLDDDATETLFRVLSEHMPGGRDALPEAKDHATAFRNAVGCILSAQSRDENTRVACEQLFSLADTPEGILELGEDEIVDAIRPAGLYNMKAGRIRDFCRALLEDFDGKLPEEREALMSLPGIGRKCADVLQRFTFGKAVVAVDTHVHRVANRTGLVACNSAEQTAGVLEERVPDWARVQAHLWMVQFGKRVCDARRPDCPDCPLLDLCLYEEKTTDEHT